MANQTHQHYGCGPARADLLWVGNPSFHLSVKTTVESYQRLSEDLRTTMLLVGICLVLIGRKEFRKQIYPWLGLVIAAYGLTQFVRGMETWVSLASFLMPLTSIVIIFDMVTRLRADAKRSWVASTGLLMAIALCATLTYINFKRTQFELRLGTDAVAIRTGGELISMRREGVRVIEVDAGWHLKDGVSNVGISDHSRFKTGDSVVSAKQLVDRLASWSSKQIEQVNR